MVLNEIYEKYESDRLRKQRIRQANCRHPPKKITAYFYNTFDTYKCAKCGLTETINNINE